MSAIAGNDREARVVEEIRAVRQRAETLQEPQVTGFIAPEFRPLVHSLLEGVFGLLYRWEGGYAGAARCRLHIYPDYLPEEDLPAVLAAVEATLPAEAGDGPGDGSIGESAGAVVGAATQVESKNEIDWLAVVRAAGIPEEKVGDILPQEGGISCQLVVAPEILEELLGRWRRVGRWPVTLRPIDVEALTPPNQRRKEMRAFVASLRLDAVAAAGFAVSRSRMVRDIRTARVKLNWKQEEDPAHPVKVGDVISIRRRGRVIVEALEGSSKKGRTAVRMVRYL